MKSKILFNCFVLSLVVPAVALGAVATAKETPKPRKAPELKVDATPVTDGKTAVLASYADVVDPIQKAVVSIYSKKMVREQFAINPFTGRITGGPREEDGLGSGVIVSSDGYILTNNHVVEGADELKVLLADERELTAKVIGADPKTDIAVIKIEADNLPTVMLADSDKLRVGDVVFAVGNPLGIGQTVTMGIVSAMGRNVKILEEVKGYESFIQTDAAINMGNSGGALVDAKGRLVGINSAILSPSKGNIGIGFAVPINLAASIMRSLVETGSVVRGYLGLLTDVVLPEDAETLGLSKNARGLVINEVVKDSPAEKAGFKAGDVITAIGDRPITTREELRLIIAQMSPGTKVKLTFFRKKKEQTVEVTLGTLDEHPDEILAGVDVALQTLTEKDRRALRLRDGEGLVITRVDEKSPFADRLAEGMVILQIDNEEITDIVTARNLLKPGRHSLLIYRNGIRRVSIEVK